QRRLAINHPKRSLTLVFVLFLNVLPLTAQRKNPAGGGSARSYARAQQVLEAGIAALGGLPAIREKQDISIVVRGSSYARNQSVAVNPPYDKMTRDENLYIDVKNRKYIIETRDPLPGGFVFGGKQVISGN